MTRRKIREQIFQMLFCIEFHQEEELQEQLLHYAEEGEEERKESDTAYIRQKVCAVAEKRTEIDEMINQASKGWKTTRMGKVDLALIRLGVYEIKFDDDIPTGVAINEAVELAKQYGTDDSSAFVNAILAKII